MSEETMTQEAVPESVATPEEATGLSEPQDLPAEYKPYSMIPWDQIPDDARQGVLEGVKKFHGGMTKGQQEAAKLRGQVGELSRKAELLDQLVAEPWVREAWEAHQKGQTVATKQPEPTVNLTEHLDADAAKAIESIIEREIGKRLGPISSQMTSINQEQANSRAKAELADLVKKATEQGLPDPYEKLDAMAQVVASGRAKSVEDAYRLATFEEMPVLVKERTRKTLQEEMQKKASNSIAPSLGGSKNGTVALYSGRDAVMNAFKDAKRELGI